MASSYGCGTFIAARQRAGHKIPVGPLPKMSKFLFRGGLCARPGRCLRAPATCTELQTPPNFSARGCTEPEKSNKNIYTSICPGKKQRFYGNPLGRGERWVRCDANELSLSLALFRALSLSLSLSRSLSLSLSLSLSSSLVSPSLSLSRSIATVWQPLEKGQQTGVF